MNVNDIIMMATYVQNYIYIRKQVKVTIDWQRCLFDQAELNKLIYAYNYAKQHETV